MVNIDYIPEKLKNHLHPDGEDIPMDCYQLDGTCGMNVLTELERYTGTRAKEYKTLVDCLYQKSHVVFTDRLDKEKTRFSHAKAIAQKGIIGMNPNSDSKIRTYTVTWDILLKAMKINPKDKKWK